MKIKDIIELCKHCKELRADHVEEHCLFDASIFERWMDCSLKDRYCNNGFYERGLDGRNWHHCQLGNAIKHVLYD